MKHTQLAVSTIFPPLNFKSGYKKAKDLAFKIRDEWVQKLVFKGVHIIYERGYVEGNGIIRYGNPDFKVTAKNIILALDSVLHVIPMELVVHGMKVLYVDDLINLEKLPSSILIIGTTCLRSIEISEFLCFFGCEVIVADQSKLLLPEYDDLVAEIVNDTVIDQRKIDYHMGVFYKLSIAGSEVKVSLKELQSKAERVSNVVDMVVF